MAEWPKALRGHTFADPAIRERILCLLLGLPAADRIFEKEFRDLARPLRFAALKGLSQADQERVQILRLLGHKYQTAARDGDPTPFREFLDDLKNDVLEAQQEGEKMVGLLQRALTAKDSPIATWDSAKARDMADVAAALTEAHQYHRIFFSARYIPLSLALHLLSGQEGRMAGILNRPGAAVKGSFGQAFKAEETVRILGLAVQGPQSPWRGKGEEFARILWESTAFRKALGPPQAFWSTALQAGLLSIEQVLRLGPERAERDPAGGEAWADLSAVCRNARRNAEALAYIEKALACAPSSPQAPRWKSERDKLQKALERSPPSKPKKMKDGENR
jgi:tetratricopeptide (TPR) repeat protein